MIKTAIASNGNPDVFLAALRALGEPTRLRLLACCARAELSVSDLVEILGQSQPRISRHLKLLCEAGLLERSREGTFAFYHLARGTPGGDLARLILDHRPPDEALGHDLARLQAIQDERGRAAAAYFRQHAAQWNKIRALHVDEKDVAAALSRLFPAAGVGDLLDIGTGTGHMLEVLAPRAQRAIGIDLSREMLALARVALERAGLSHCSVRQGDMYHLPFAPESFDAVVIHQVLHYATRPAAVLDEAARVLRKDGMLLIVDFAPHDREDLRLHHAHRRLGFADSEVAFWLEEAGLGDMVIEHLPGKPLTVTLWRAWNRRKKSLSARHRKGDNSRHSSPPAGGDERI